MYNNEDLKSLGKLSVKDIVADKDLLEKLVCYQYGEMVLEPAKVVDSLNEYAEIYINGEKVKIAELHNSRGNGHVDYYFILDDSFSRDFVDSVALRCGMIPDESLKLFYENLSEVTGGNLQAYQRNP